MGVVYKQNKEVNPGARYLFTARDLWLNKEGSLRVLRIGNGTLEPTIKSLNPLRVHGGDRGVLPRVLTG